MVYDDDVRAREEIVVFSAEDTRRSQEVLSPSDEGKKIIMRKIKKNVVVCECFQVQNGNPFSSLSLSWDCKEIKKGDWGITISKPLGQENGKDPFFFFSFLVAGNEKKEFMTAACDYNDGVTRILSSSFLSLSFLSLSFSFSSFSFSFSHFLCLLFLPFFFFIFQR